MLAMRNPSHSDDVKDVLFKSLAPTFFKEAEKLLGLVWSYYPTSWDWAWDSDINARYKRRVTHVLKEVITAPHDLIPIIWEYHGEPRPQLKTNKSFSYQSNVDYDGLAIAMLDALNEDIPNGVNTIFADIKKYQDAFAEFSGELKLCGDNTHHLIINHPWNDIATPLLYRLLYMYTIPFNRWIEQFNAEGVDIARNALKNPTDIPKHLITTLKIRILLYDSKTCKADEYWDNKESWFWNIFHISKVNEIEIILKNPQTPIFHLNLECTSQTSNYAGFDLPAPIFSPITTPTLFVTLENYDFKGVSFNNANFKNMDFGNGDLSETFFNQGNLSGSYIIDAKFINSRFINTNFSSTHFFGGTVAGSYFQNCLFNESKRARYLDKKCNFSDAVFFGCDFTLANFSILKLLPKTILDMQVREQSEKDERFKLFIPFIDKGNTKVSALNFFRPSRNREDYYVIIGLIQYMDGPRNYFTDFDAFLSNLVKKIDSELRSLVNQFLSQHSSRHGNPTHINQCTRK